MCQVLKMIDIIMFTLSEDNCVETIICGSFSTTYLQQHIRVMEYEYIEVMYKY